MAISLLPTFSPRTSLVYLHNGKPPFNTVLLQSDTPLEKLTLTVSFSPDYIKPQTYRIDELQAGEPHAITPRRPEYDLARLKAITEEEPGQMLFTLRCEEQILHEQHFNFSWLPSNAWVMDAHMQHPELLATLVQPNDPVVDKTLHQAGSFLQKKGENPNWSGYDANPSKQAIITKLEAIWYTVANYNINYALPPCSEVDGDKGILQKIRTPSQIIQGGCATCHEHG